MGRERGRVTDSITARFINGIGTGILNAIVPVWATETAEHTSRGQFIAIEFTLNIFGVVLAYWLELYVFPIFPYQKRSNISLLIAASPSSTAVNPPSAGVSPSPSRSSSF